MTPLPNLPFAKRTTKAFGSTRQNRGCEDNEKGWSSLIWGQRKRLGGRQSSPSPQPCHPTSGSKAGAQERALERAGAGVPIPGGV